jgi:hypothetical protein
MATSRVDLFEDEIEQSFVEEFTASDQSSLIDESDSSGTDDLTVGEVIGAECCDNESDNVQFATTSSVPSASSALSAVFMWEDMTHYAGQREQFVDNYGPQNEAQNDTQCAKVFRMFFDELVELIVHEIFKVRFYCIFKKPRHS